MASVFGMGVGELSRYGLERAKEIGSPADLDVPARSLSCDMQRTVQMLGEGNAIDVRDHERRLVRLERMVEMAQGRAGPPLTDDR